MNLSICQVNPIVGDLKYNFEKVVSFIERCENSKIICFPELCLTGYPPEDMLFYPHFIEDQYQYLEKIKKYSNDKIIVIGFVGLTDSVYNSAAIVENQNIWVYNKVHLPNYGVFDEQRYFKNGDNTLIIESKEGIKVGFTICEDIWYPADPLLSLASAGADLVINISASPYHVVKPVLREDMLKTRSSDYGVFIAYCNLVGGQDELVFDGTSSVISNRGETICRAPSFREYILDCYISLEDLKASKFNPIRRNLPKSGMNCTVIKTGLSLVSENKKDENKCYKFFDREHEIFEACVLGTRDYIIKNDFNKVIVAMSGGIDSSLVSCIACEAIGPKNVLGISMPSMFSSSHSVEDAQFLAKSLGINFEIIPISDIYDNFIHALSDIYDKFGNRSFTVAEENLQSRIRGNIIMTLSNKFEYLVLACGNKSEMSVGYATLYGDLAGGFAPIKDLYKTEVYKVSQWYNSRNLVIPDRVFTKPPSAELRPDQTDQDTLPPYEVLDSILKMYLEGNFSPSYIADNLKIDKEFVRKIIKSVEIAEYKRRQAPPGVKLTSRAFGKDRRLPITKRI
ncbi:MAG: NAD+ synthase [Candidatus Calescibacterium sp.]|nr:NAD+ synthase [Candidatus Calescibacterium sp.]